MTLSSMTDSLLWQYAMPGYGSSYNPMSMLALASASSAAQSGTSTTSSSTTSQAISADQASLSGLDQLSTALSTFQTAMEGLTTADQVAPATASSSDTAVATASAQSTATTGTYNVTVNSLAQSQTVESGAVSDPSATVIGSGTLTIQLGTYDSSSNTFTAGSTSPVSISVTNGSLDDIASAINNAGAGVTASVVQDSSGYHLSITSNSTGAANGFSVSVSDSDGNNTDTSGLSQLAYDPTATAGAGKNLTETQAAQDASFSVNGVAQTSASNSGVSIGSGISLQLLQTGSTTVSVSQDTGALEAAAQNFVDAYNSLYDTLGSLTGTSGALAGDPVAQQLQNDLQNTSIGSFTAGSFSGLAQIGITAQTDGHLSLDTTALQTAYTSDMSSTVSVLNQAAQAMDTMASNYTDPASGAVPTEQSILQDNLFQLQLISGLAPDTSTSTSSQAAYDQYQAYLSALTQQSTSALLSGSLSGSSTTSGTTGLFA